MITTALIYFIYFTVVILTSILPTGGTFPEVFHSSAVALNSNLYFWDPIFPMDTLVYLIAFSGTFALAIIGFKIVNWLIAYIRGGQSL